MEKIRIAILASNFIRIPPRPKDIPPQCSGAPEMMTSIIAENLVERGHDVTLFASGDSKTKGKLISVTEKATGTDPKIGFNPTGPQPHANYEYLLISKAYQMAKKNHFDIIHSQLDIPTAFFAPLTKTPTISTLHSPLSRTRQLILGNFKNTQYYISISNAQRKPLPDLNYAATIYHGIDSKKIPFDKNPEDFLVITGRIHPNKGIKEAIMVAKKTGKKLILMGSHGRNDEYWKKDIKPEIDGRQIIYKGFLGHEEMFKIIKKAAAYILPLQWEEPFGLTMIETMACGTPVIAFDRGSVPEIIKNEKTGFICRPNDLDSMVKAIKRIYRMPEKEYLEMRYRCRKSVEEKFTVERMVSEHEKVYRKILKTK
jgi:glycosyltransferase involved in cell wall biosynthesis